MAARRIPKRRRATVRTRARRKTRASLKRSIARIEEELPATLRSTRLLREASHQLGRFEAEGELRWKRLTARARRDALKLLRRLEREIGPSRRKAGRKVATLRRRKRTARKAVGRAAQGTPRIEAVGSGI
jgi:hypothetical protein